MTNDNGFNGFELSDELSLLRRSLRDFVEPWLRVNFKQQIPGVTLDAKGGRR